MLIKIIKIDDRFKPIAPYGRNWTLRE